METVLMLEAEENAEPCARVPSLPRVAAQLLGKQKQMSVCSACVCSFVWWLLRLASCCRQ